MSTAQGHSVGWTGRRELGGKSDYTLTNIVQLGKILITDWLWGNENYIVPLVLGAPQLTVGTEPPWFSRVCSGKI